MREMFVRFLEEEDGQDLVEYSYLAGFIAAAAFAFLPNLAATLSGWFGIPQVAVRITGGVVAVVLLTSIVIRRRRLGQEDS